jgi:hypothetical protein
VIAAASQTGVMSLSLRPLNTNSASQDSATAKNHVAAYNGAVSVIRYGLAGGNRQETQ